MAIPLYQVDAFTSELFGGNPAAVCPLESWLPDVLMQQIAMENNLSETAFIVPEGNGYRIRWFTPVEEVKLCGHATLATAHVLFERHGELNELHFESLSGPLKVTRDGKRLTLDFPAWPHHRADAPQGLAEALGTSIAEFYEGNYRMAVLENETAVAVLEPDFRALNRIAPKGLIVTAAGDSADFVSRSFFPGYNIDEDPVTGSSHCMLTPYWAARLNKQQFTARQLSVRGGELGCRLADGRVFISGEAVPYLKGEILL